MKWTEQSEDLMKAWAETQAKIWEGWRGAAEKNGPLGSDLWGDWLDRWRELASQAVSGWSSGATEVPSAVIGRLFSGEEVFLRFLEMALGAFRTVAPQIDAGEDWVELLRRYLVQMKDEMTRPPAAWMTPEGVATLSRDVPELWSLYTAELQKLGTPWFQSLRDARWRPGDAAAGDREAAVKLYNLFMDNYEATFGKYLSAPAIGFSREMSEKVLRGFEAWVDYKRAHVEFQTEMVSTGFKALESLLRELVETTERKEKITSFRSLFDLWVATAEKAYFDLFSTDSFSQLQGRLVNSAMRYKLREREVTEELLGAVNLPTRTEIDDIHRHVHDLRDELKALKRQVEALKKEAAAAPKPPAPRSRRAKARTNAA